MKRILALILAVVLCCTLATAALADGTGFDPSAPASLSIYKYNFTAAENAGVQGLGSWVSTGIADAEVEAAMAPYTVQGVVFSYVKVGNYFSYSGIDDGTAVVMNQYELPDNATTAAFLSLLGLSAANAHHKADGNLYFDSSVLIDALKAKSASPTALMDAAEQFFANNGASAMPETDANGYTTAALDQGLYIVAETSVPEYINNVTIPFLISLPVPSPDGSDNWTYNATVYPKNWADRPDLEKTLREDPGISTGTTNDYTHNATASVGDTINYHITSTLPTITSNVTRLTQYTYDDTLSKGLTYKKDGVTIEWYVDKACTDKIATWNEDSGKFIVEYGEKDDAATMQVRMSATGLAEINTSTAVYGSGSTYHGYSGCTMRISYNCVLDEDAVLGSAGNPNDVTLTWSRSNTNYWDTLTDDCHVYTYGIDIAKMFVGKVGNFDKVKFVVRNETDNYYVVAKLENGVYYVTGKADTAEGATQFVPQSSGIIYIRGLEDDKYILTETETDPNFMLLAAPIEIEITTAGNGVPCPVCGKQGLEASATVDGAFHQMADDESCAKARVALTVKNHPKPEIPSTGDHGTSVFTVLGTLGLLLSSVFVFNAASKRKFQHQ